MNLAEFNKKYKPCSEARTFLKMYKGYNWQHIWFNCQKPEWMGWLLDKMEHRKRRAIIRSFGELWVSCRLDNVIEIQKRFELAKECLYLEAAIIHVKYYVTTWETCAQIRQHVPNCPIKGKL